MDDTNNIEQKNKMQKYMGIGFFLRWLKCLEIDCGGSYTIYECTKSLHCTFTFVNYWVVHCISMKTFPLIGPFFFLFSFWLYHMACEQPGIEPQACSPFTVRRSLNHWTPKEIHSMKTLKDKTVLHTCVKLSGSLFFSIDQGVDPYKHILDNKSCSQHNSSHFTLHFLNFWNSSPFTLFV